MVYRALGIMSGSSLDGLDLAAVEFHENAGNWKYRFIATACYPYSPEWGEKLRTAIELTAVDYLLLHSAYGHYLGEQVKTFIKEQSLEYNISLISSHGHTSFHMPGRGMTAQLGEGAGIAAETRLPVVTDLRAMDVAEGGQGAPIVPIGEKYLFPGYDYFLNIGGIANISLNAENYIAFDVCPANRVLNMLAAKEGKEYDEGGRLAASGELIQGLLDKLNALDYYHKPHPKSLANDFGTELVYGMIRDWGCKNADALRTYAEHIAVQVSRSISQAGRAENKVGRGKLLVTGGGAFNQFLIERLTELLGSQKIELVVGDEQLVNFKEALVMAFIGILRWRQEYNVLSSVTGAKKDSIGGALWAGE